MVDVCWSMTVEDDADFLGPIAKDHTILLPPWAESAGNAYEVAQTIVETWWTDELWREWFGEDDRAGLIVQIHAPEQIAGRYFVDADRIIKAQVHRSERP